MNEANMTVIFSRPRMNMSSSGASDVFVFLTDSYCFDVDPTADPVASDGSALPSGSPEVLRPFSIVPGSCRPYAYLFRSATLRIDPSVVDDWETAFDGAKAVEIHMLIDDDSSRWLTMDLRCLLHPKLQLVSLVAQAVQFALLLVIFPLRWLYVLLSFRWRRARQKAARRLTASHTHESLRARFAGQQMPDS